jgi:hemoglobin
MKLFWRSVLLKTGEYKGSPPKAHLEIGELQSTDFAIWLDMFEETSSDCFSPDAAQIANEYARRIARSLWLTCFGTPFDRPPF